MEVKIEELLPIGTIVLLNGSDKRVMITGTIMALSDGEKNIVYDYMGCLWPEGILDVEKNMLFNKQDIKEVVNKGVRDEEELNSLEVISDKLLPIGSIVSINNSEKKLMIVGLYITLRDNIEIYDYMGCLWPEGVLDINNNLVFNKENITKVYKEGFSDDEEKEYKEKLEAFYLKIQQKGGDK